MLREREFITLGVLCSLLFVWKNDMDALGGAWWLRKEEDFCSIDDDGTLCGFDNDEE